MLAGDVFVFHEGAVSFSEERSALTENAGKTLMDLHPDYVRKVREFVARDPAGALRAAVDGARLALGTDELRHLLVERTEERRLLDRSIAEEQEPLITALREGWPRRRGCWSNATWKFQAAVGARSRRIARLQTSREIEELHRSWVWKCREFVLRMSTWRRPPSRP